LKKRRKKLQRLKKRKKKLQRLKKRKKKRRKKLLVLQLLKLLLNQLPLLLKTTGKLLVPF